MTWEAPTSVPNPRLIHEGSPEEVSWEATSHWEKSGSQGTGIDGGGQRGCSGPALPAVPGLFLPQGLLGQPRDLQPLLTSHSPPGKSSPKQLQLEGVVGIRGHKLLFWEPYPPKIYPCPPVLPLLQRPGLGPGLGVGQRKREGKWRRRSGKECRPGPVAKALHRRLV